MYTIKGNLTCFICSEEFDEIHKNIKSLGQIYDVGELPEEIGNETRLTGGDTRV